MKRRKERVVLPGDPDYHKTRSCTDKAYFGTEGEARRRSKEIGCGLYHCRYCGGWHMTRYADDND